MKRLSLGILLAAMVAAPLSAALKTGQKAPEFSANASLAGHEFQFSLASALKKGPVVVYFFPSAFTRGCDLEAHTFAVNKAKFDAAGATIIGVSQDSIERLNAFSADPNYCASKIAVASDPHGAIARSYDLKVMAGRPGMKDVRGVVIGHAFTERTTFVVMPNDKVVATFSTSADHINPAQHVERALAIVQRLARERTSKH
ncbi:MAG TPA: peroxiredoxin [Vicinamibacterales bacterium]|nr:peroxiredoxin [Vicinamibacterales bacterium]